MARRDRKWVGGFVRRDGQGRDIYWIRRQVNGKEFELSTRCTSERAAIEHLRRFEADPSGYEPTNAPDELRLTTALVQEFLAWSKAKGNSADWVNKQRSIMAWWAPRLGRNLKAVKTSDLATHCASEGPAKHHRIEVVKCFYGWLRKHRHLITPAEDPTFEALPVPQLKPAQARKVKAVPPKAYRRVLAQMEGMWRHRLDVLGVTGWHLSELLRFARGGAIEPHPTKRGERVLVCPRGKDGAPRRTAVTAKEAKAAEIVLQAGGFARGGMYLALKEACKRAKVAPFGPGVMRHSVATAAVNAGEPLERVASFLGHRSTRTTSRFYSTHSVPARVRTLKP